MFVGILEAGFVFLHKASESCHGAKAIIAGGVVIFRWMDVLSMGVLGASK